MTYLRELDVVALVDTHVDPLQDALVGFHVLVLDDQGTGIAIELLSPDLTEDSSSATGELGHEAEQRLILASALPDGDEFLLAILAVHLKPGLEKSETLSATQFIVRYMTYDA